MYDEFLLHVQQRFARELIVTYCCREWLTLRSRVAFGATFLRLLSNRPQGLNRPDKKPLLAQALPRVVGYGALCALALATAELSLRGFPDDYSGFSR